MLGKTALMASSTADATEAAEKLRESFDWCPMEEAERVVALGGDGFMLQVLHSMLANERIIPVFGLNRGTVGFLMNIWKDSLQNFPRRLDKAKHLTVIPLSMTARTMDGETFTYPAINEVSLLRETRQTAKLEVSVNGRVRIPELVADGVLVATPAGSTAYNLSANGPILPLGSPLLALTPISPFRPRRWKGAILQDSSEISIKVLEPAKRPVSVVADQKEIRDICEINIRKDSRRSLTLMFDPEHSLDDRIAMEQFVV
ncbi:NAD kinase [Alterisphingorhabdus coralli]|uniref:NAD kinase n=1 Tax=Alterisphingorhabdus coralli TaxID=3071408 RepID=A0AA97I0E6_9SPHN|nr:NAD kinase [Parasphingorhabdus sp. SCSIO 66989]WOE74115.1 NAD kinase [Parasphingorhabdus sp. SCSIO 66989]